MAHINLGGGFLINRTNEIEQIIGDYKPHVFGIELTRRIMSGLSSSFSLRSVLPDEIIKIIDGMKSTRSCGQDNIDTYVIKLAKEELTPVITHLVNLSITSNVFPKLWKNAKVIPLHKKDEVIYPQKLQACCSTSNYK